MDWKLACLHCGAESSAEGIPTVCRCGEPWIVEYPSRSPDPSGRERLPQDTGMWRFRSLLPLLPDESPVTHTHQLLPLHETFQPICRVVDKVTQNNVSEVVDRAIAACLSRPYTASCLTLSAKEALKPVTMIGRKYNEGPPTRPMATIRPLHPLLQPRLRPPHRPPRPTRTRTAPRTHNAGARFKGSTTPCCATSNSCSSAKAVSSS